MSAGVGPRDADQAGRSASGREREGCDALVGRVRQALAADGAGTGPARPVIEAATVRRLERSADLVEHFAAAATALGMQVSRVGAGALAGRVEESLRAIGARRACASLEAGPLADAVDAAAQTCNCALLDWRERDGLDAHYEVDCGIGDVVAAVAETGSLVVAADADHSRATHLVPPCHLALVPADRIVPDLIDLWQMLAERGLNHLAAVTLVSGPSKTADIEGILITGVHGPGTVRVIVIEEDGP